MEVDLFVYASRERFVAQAEDVLIAQVMALGRGLRAAGCGRTQKDEHNKNAVHAGRPRLTLSGLVKEVKASPKDTKRLYRSLGRPRDRAPDTKGTAEGFGRGRVSIFYPQISPQT